MPILKRRCLDCATEYELLSLGGIETALDYDEDIHMVGCPSCKGSNAQAMVGLSSGFELGGQGGVGKRFPYFDRALGCEVNSAQHRRWLLEHNPNGTKRDFKLIPTDGAWDPHEEIKEETKQAEEDAKVYGEYIDEQVNGPDRADYHHMLRVLPDMMRREEGTALDEYMKDTGY